MLVQDSIIDMECPCSIVDHPSFLRAMNTIDPRFTVLSRRTLRREALPFALDRLMKKVEQACADAKFVALTLDAWSCRRVRTYLRIAMYKIGEKDRALQNCLLTFQHIAGKFPHDKMISHTISLS